MSSGKYTVSYLLEATTSGFFLAGPARVEEMYNPQVFGYSPAAYFKVK
jgi:uncharacterized protein YfaS (alpha-2-macroglobulin family)